MWQELLNKEPIGIRDNFFLLGGHSLLAARLIARIERACGRSIPLSTLFANPTIEQLSEVLQKQEDLGRSSLVVEVQPGRRSHVPLFFFHGDPNEGPFYCFKLARALGKEQPFYACAPYRFKKDELPPTFEAMAEAYLTAIREIQPEGPYQLGGFCNGGLVAYEVARQLQAINQQVDLLFLVDPSPFAYNKWVRDLAAPLVKLFRVSEEQELAWTLRLRYIYRYLRFSFVRRYYRERRAAASTSRVALLSMLYALLPPSVEVLHQDWSELFFWVISTYVPSSPYTGKVTFVWTEVGASTRTVWLRTPEQRAGEVHFLQGGHMDWVRNNLDELIEILRVALLDARKADRRRASP
jgi:hypothetical protein